MSLVDALKDLKDEMTAGTDLEVAADRIAADYGMNPRLLVRKAEENGWTVEKLQAFVSATDPEKVFAEKVKAEIERFIKHYRPSGQTHGTVFIRGTEKFTYIGSETANRHICIRHSDAAAFVLNAAALRNSTFEAEARKQMGAL